MTWKVNSAFNFIKWEIIKSRGQNVTLRFFLAPSMITIMFPLLYYVLPELHDCTKQALHNSESRWIYFNFGQQKCWITRLNKPPETKNSCAQDDARSCDRCVFLKTHFHCRLLHELHCWCVLCALTLNSSTAAMLLLSMRSFSREMGSLLLRTSWISSRVR